MTAGLDAIIIVKDVQDVVIHVVLDVKAHVLTNAVNPVNLTALLQ